MSKMKCYNRVCVWRNYKKECGIEKTFCEYNTPEHLKYLNERIKIMYPFARKEE